MAKRVTKAVLLGTIDTQKVELEVLRGKLNAAETKLKTMEPMPPQPERGYYDRNKPPLTWRSMFEGADRDRNDWERAARQAMEGAAQLARMLDDRPDLAKFAQWLANGQRGPAMAPCNACGSVVPVNRS